MKKIHERVQRIPLKAKLLAFVAIGDGQERRMLDFGCGNGFWSESEKSLPRVTA